MTSGGTNMTNNNAISTSTNHASNGHEEKVLTFQLGAETYGVEILQVREIIGLIDVTVLPQTPNYVKGVINLRGKIIPVIELRTRFELESVDYTAETCIIVVEVESADDTEPFEIGIIVDTVSEVVAIPEANIEAAPRFGGSVNTDFLRGMGKVDENVVILLDLNRVLSEQDVELLAGTANGSNESTPNQMAA